MNKNQIRNILNGIDKEKYSHVLICVDTFNYDYFVEQVKRDYDIDEFISNFWKKHKGGMFKIEEIYNLDLDIEEQLSEYRSNHREKANRKIIEKYPEMETISERALKFAAEKHKGQYRKGKNQKPYITHPINVANLLKKYKESHKIDTLVAAAYLHDTLENTDASFYELVKKFGIEIAALVREVSTDKDLKNEVGKVKYLAIKMKNMTDWALDIKLCDRLDNVSDLVDVDFEFRDKYIKETLYIINYLVQNRKLTNTHLTIIKDIIKVLNIIITYNYDNQSNITIEIKNLIYEINQKEVS